MSSSASVEWEDFLTMFAFSAGAYAFFIIVSFFLEHHVLSKEKAKERLEATVLFSDDEGVLNRWERLQAALRTDSLLSRMLDVTEIITDFVVMIFYVVRSYRQEFSLWLSIIDGVAFGILAIIFLARFSVATSPMRFMTSGDTFVDMLTIPSEFAALTFAVDSYLTLGFLRSFRAYVTFDAIERRWLGNSSIISDSERQILRMLIATLSFLYVFAGSVSTVELLGEPELFEGVERDDWNFFSSVYFAIVTSSTVGYGDISPSTALGRLLVIVFIVAGIIFFTRETSILVDLLSTEGRGTGKYVSALHYNSVLVSGEINRQILEEFLREFYHPDHPATERQTRVVVMLGSTYSADDRRWIVHHDRYSSLVTYLKGSVFNAEDIGRCGAMTASVAFLFTNSVGEPDDSTNVLRALALRRFVPGLPIFASLSFAENRQHMIAAGVPYGNILCMDEFKLGFVSQGVATPGAPTLLLNLLSSESYTGGKKLEPWQQAYTEGLVQEVYEISAPTQLVGKTLQEALLALYTDGLETRSKAHSAKSEQQETPLNVDGSGTPDELGEAMSGIPKLKTEWRQHPGPLLFGIQRIASDGSREFICDLSDTSVLIRGSDKCFVISPDETCLPKPKRAAHLKRESFHRPSTPPHHTRGLVPRQPHKRQLWFSQDSLRLSRITSVEQKESGSTQAAESPRSVPGADRRSLLSAVSGLSALSRPVAKGTTLAGLVKTETSADATDGVLDVADMTPSKTEDLVVGGKEALDPDELKLSVPDNQPVVSNRALLPPPKSPSQAPSRHVSLSSARRPNSAPGNPGSSLDPEADRERKSRGAGAGAGGGSGGGSGGGTGSGAKPRSGKGADKGRGGRDVPSTSPSSSTIAGRRSRTRPSSLQEQERRQAGPGEALTAAEAGLRAGAGAELAGSLDEGNTNLSAKQSPHASRALPSAGSDSSRKPPQSIGATRADADIPTVRPLAPVSPQPDKARSVPGPGAGQPAVPYAHERGRRQRGSAQVRHLPRSSSPVTRQLSIATDPATPGQLPRSARHLDSLPASYGTRKGLAELLPPSGIENHIIVCASGSMSSILLLLIPLRRHSPNRPVVVLSDDAPWEWWRFTAPYGPIYFIKGSPQLSADLLRAHITTANRVVVLASKTTGESADVEFLLTDRHALFSTMLIENRFSEFNPCLIYGTITEFRNDESILLLRTTQEIVETDRQAQRDGPESPHDDTESFLDSMAEPVTHATSEIEHDAEIGFKWSSRYAAGRLFALSSLNSILAQAFYNPHLISLAETFATGRAMRIRFCSVPKAFVGRTYHALVYYLVSRKNAIPIGLYRDYTAFNAALPFVHTNPASGSRVNEGDLVFIVQPGESRFMD